MGRVKDHFWDEINARAEQDADEGPDELEMLEMDAVMAESRYQAELQKRAAEGRHNEGENHERRC